MRLENRSLLYVIIAFWVPVPIFAHQKVSFQWQNWGKDTRHTNFSLINFSTSRLKHLWSFDLGEHTYEYTARLSVWSSSAVAAEIDGETLIFTGSYTHNLYAIRARDGKEVWRFTTGRAINSAPVIARFKQRTVVIAASTDRVIYCLDAKTGEKIWSYTIYDWTFTVFEGISASPIVVELEGKPYLVLGYWYADRRPLKNIQRGIVLCIDVATGKKVWSKVVGQSYLFTPAFVRVKDKDMIFITSRDGNIYSLSAEDGELFWKFTSSIPITSSPSVVKTGGSYSVFFGTYYGMFFQLDAYTGEIVRKKKFKMQISYPGATGEVNGRKVMFIPNYDRNLYALDISSGEILWKYPTRQHLASSPIICKVNEKPVVVFPSMDNNLYLLDAETGKLLWKFKLGRRLWAYEVRGQTYWPSPIVITDNDKPVLILPWYDGKIYAFGD